MSADERTLLTITVTSEPSLMDGDYYRARVAEGAGRTWTRGAWHVRVAVLSALRARRRQLRHERRRHTAEPAS